MMGAARESGLKKMLMTVCIYVDCMFVLCIMVGFMYERVGG